MRFLTLFFLSILLISCQDEEPEIKTATALCLGTPSAIGFESCETDPFDIPQFCESEFLGSYELLEESYEYLPQYCTNQNSTIVYTNTNGDSLNLVLSFKSFNKSKSAYNTFVECDDDATKTKSVCIDNEAIRIQLDSAEPELSLAITLQSKLEVATQGIGDFLEVTRTDTATGSLYLEFSSVIAQRTLSYATTFNQEYFDKLKLNTIEYTNVISNDISNFQNPKYKFYFNTEKGMIGFRDTNDVLWTLSE